MEIINKNHTFLTNFEVIQALRNIRDTKKKFGLRNLATLTYETLQYLEDTPCKNQTAESIANFITEIKPFNLHKRCILIMINAPPTTDLQIVIADKEGRLTEDQIPSILEIVKRTLLVA